MGADEVIDFTQEDPVAAIKRLTAGRGVDVATEALGQQQTFEWCLEATRPGGTVSSLGVYGGKLDLAKLITHRFELDAIEDAYELFGNQRDGVVKVAITPVVRQA